MSFQISQVQFHSVKAGNQYLLDSNIWIQILSPKNETSFKNKQYYQLFQKIIKNKDVKIILPALLISEVLNRLLREVHMNKFARKNGYKKGQGLPSDFFKDKFRPSPDFKLAYNILCDDIRSYSNSITLVNDSFGTNINYEDVLLNPPQGLDFNDYFYYILAKKNDYIIVTDDKDFWVEDVKMVTENNTIIEKNKILVTSNRSQINKKRKSEHFPSLHNFFFFFHF